MVSPPPRFSVARFTMLLTVAPLECGKRFEYCGLTPDLEGRGTE